MKRLSAIYRPKTIIFIGDTMNQTFTLSHAEVAVLEAIFYAEVDAIAALNKDRKNAPVDEWRFEGVRASKDTSSLAPNGKEYPNCFRVQRRTANRLEEQKFVVSTFDEIFPGHYESRFRLTEKGRNAMIAVRGLGHGAGKRYICLNERRQP